MLIGANGQLGRDLCRELSAVELTALRHQDIEITDMESVATAFEKHKPQAVINTAAYLRVDDCEGDPDRAYGVNALGARNVAVMAQEWGAKLFHISTDYVFGGEANPTFAPYTEFDLPVPANTYGKSKLAGERLVQHLCSKHFIIRSSGLYGVAGARAKGGNFVETILRLAGEGRDLTVVNDQILSPTYTKDLARKIAQLLATPYYGIFHITNKGACSWYDFACHILKLSGLSVKVTPVPSQQRPTPAPRPPYSVLDNCHLRLLGMDDLRPWQEALADYLVQRETTMEISN